MVARPVIAKLVEVACVKVALVRTAWGAMICPAETTRPCDEARPALEMPPALVEVPVPVTSNWVIRALPAVTSRPCDEERPTTERPALVKVEVAVPRNESTFATYNSVVVARPVAERFVEVAWVVVENMPDKWVMVEEALLLNSPPRKEERPVTLRVDEAKKEPEGLTESRCAPAAFCILKRLTACPELALIVRGMAVVVVASMNKAVLVSGEVVPNEEGVVVPETALDKSENGAEVSLCLGERVSNEELLLDTSTWRYKSLFWLKSRSRTWGKPPAVSPMFTLKTPLVTVRPTLVGAATGQRREPEEMALVVQMENLK